MGKTTVIHIITKLELGGAQQNTLFTVDHLDRSRFDPVLIAGAGGLLDDEAKGLSGVKVFLVPSLLREVSPCRDLAALFSLRAIIKRLVRERRRKSGGDCRVIVHTHSSKAGILGRLAARLAGVRLIVHSVHGFGFNAYQSSLVRSFYIFLERLASRVTTAVITVSRSNRQEGIARGIVNGENTVLIRSGIDIETFQRGGGDPVTLRSSLGVAQNLPLVAMVACFKPQKAPLDFVRVAKKVLGEVNTVQFLLVGDGMLRPELEALIDEYGIGDRLILSGWRRDIPGIMHAIDILVLTSLWEGLPRVLPQAMAAGVPVVATRVDGSPEAVKEGVNGFLLPPGDITGMAEKVIFFLNNPSTARSMGRRGRELVAEFDIRRMLEEQEKLYGTLLTRGRLDGAAH